MERVFVFAVCLVASTIGGICGVGGGVIIKPLLDSFGIMSVSSLSFLSGLTVLSMSIISVYKSRKTKELDWKHSLPLSIGAALGGVVGKHLFERVKSVSQNDALVGGVQAIVLCILVIGTLIYVQNKKRIVTKQVKSPVAGVVIGFLLGISSSFLGIGGGPMNLVVLYYFYSMSTKEAAINSILIILFSQMTSLLFSMTMGNIPAFDPLLLVIMVLAGVLGGFLSSSLRKKLTESQTQRMFAGLLIVIILICVCNAWQMLG